MFVVFDAWFYAWFLRHSDKIDRSLAISLTGNVSRQMWVHMMYLFYYLEEIKVRGRFLNARLHGGSRWMEGKGALRQRWI